MQWYAGSPHIVGVEEEDKGAADGASNSTERTEAPTRPGHSVGLPAEKAYAIFFFKKSTVLLIIVKFSTKNPNFF
jgi:hypothetical protein